MVLSSVWNLVYAVGIGLLLASLFFMKKIGDVTAKLLEVKVLSEESWPDEKDFPEKLKEEVFIKHLNGPLFFGSTSEFQQLAGSIPDTANTVIIRLERMQYLDQSGLYAMEDVVFALKLKNVNVLFVGLQEQPKLMMERTDIIPDLVAREHIFPNFTSCLEWVKDNVKDKVA